MHVSALSSIYLCNMTCHQMIIAQKLRKIQYVWISRIYLYLQSGGTCLKRGYFSSSTVGTHDFLITDKHIGQALGPAMQYFQFFNPSKLYQEFWRLVFENISHFSGPSHNEMHLGYTSLCFSLQIFAIGYGSTAELHNFCRTTWDLCRFCKMPCIGTYNILQIPQHFCMTTTTSVERLQILQKYHAEVPVITCRACSTSV